jgi:hypothetical protein
MSERRAMTTTRDWIPTKSYLEAMSEARICAEYASSFAGEYDGNAQSYAQAAQAWTAIAREIREAGLR